MQKKLHGRPGFEATSTCARFACSMQIERYNLHVICLDSASGHSADPGLSHVEAADYKQLQNNTVQKQHLHDKLKRYSIRDEDSKVYT